jgi:hypothetical protein
VNREASNVPPTRSTPQNKFSNIRAKRWHFYRADFESTELTIELQPVKLCIWGVDVFADFTTPKFAGTAIG